jgi:hypothetical protein
MMSPVIHRSTRGSAGRQRSRMPISRVLRDQIGHDV